MKKKKKKKNEWPPRNDANEFSSHSLSYGSTATADDHQFIKLYVWVNVCILLMTVTMDDGRSK